uniref:S8 family serine peptidase n=1 Tax=Saccharothrix mutabilis TaxID=33921 RepID=UPI0031DF9035
MAATTDRPADFFVLLRSRADLAAARDIGGHGDRVRFVYEAVRADAQRTQADLLRELGERGVRATPFWIANAVKVTGDRALVADIAARDEVVSILPDRELALVDPVRKEPAGGVQGVEWNVEQVRAPEVWNTFGDRGEGVVVGTIDTGAQFDHPAIARRYRGAERPGTLDHAYSWFDPSRVCGSPSVVPCDNIGHGTHVLGTILGDDGAGNQVGVAPGATWIAAKGCETTGCSTTALLAAGQWMLAPTDFDGANPRPDLAPHVVNNSWAGPPGDPLFREVVRTWVAAGIFPVFAAGNIGSACGSAQSPGDYPESYAVGAHDAGGAIASFSSRGPSAFGVVKPDVVAPGVNVRSSVPGGGYAYYDGTSMATPHVTATVALAWSVSHALVGDVAATRELLDAAARPVDDVGCGGVGEHNNVWGHGRLDAFEVVSRAPKGPVGTLTGVVHSGGQPLVGARVRVEGPVGRTVATDSVGGYQLRLPVGRYRLTIGKFGHLDHTADVEVRENESTAHDADLAVAPRHTVSGHVRDEAGTPLPGARVSFPGTPLPTAVADKTGSYVVADVPQGHYDAVAEGGDCLLPARAHVEVEGDTTVDFALPAKSDAHGHVCSPTASKWVSAGTVLPLSGWEGATQVALPFPVNLYGQSYRTAQVNVNGYLNFTPSAAGRPLNTPIPHGDEPNTAVYAFWDDLVVDAAASVRSEVVGTAPDRAFVVEWRNVTFPGTPHLRVGFEVVLHENGPIVVQYQGIDDDPVERGASATVGVENEAGTDALQYSADRPVLGDATAVVFRVPGTGYVRGTVTDANDGKPVAGATVTAVRDGAEDQVVTTDQDGVYQVRARVGDVRLRFAARDYGAEEATARVEAEHAITVRDATLRTGRLEARPAALEIVVPPGQSRTRTVTLANTGTAELSWQVKEAGASTTTRAAPRELPDTTDARTTRGLPGSEVAATAPPAPVLRSWTATGVQAGWGVGYRDGPWISDQGGARNAHYTDDGVLDKLHAAPWAGYWVGDMAYVPSQGLMCQNNIGGDNGIHCWNPDTGEVVDRITGPHPWNGGDKRALAHRPDDDTFYVAGWEGVVYRVKGLSHPDRGAVVGRCVAADPNISGLGWNSAFGVLWAATNSSSDTIYALNPDTCQVLKTLGAPDNAPWTGAGLETDDAGRLWVVSQGSPTTVYQLDGGVPDFTDAPWLRISPETGALSPGGSARFDVRVDATGLAPGVYGATAIVVSTTGRTRTVAIPIKVVVPAHQVALNSGGTPHVDAAGDTWALDRAYAPGGHGFLDDGRSRVVSTTRPIAGTDEQRLYRNLREGAYEYRFDGVPNGVYAVELKFAELGRTRPNSRLFDVIAEDRLLLPAVDVVGAVGRLTAMDRTVHVEVTDGQLNLRLVDRRGAPIVNAIRVTHRPDLTG